MPEAVITGLGPVAPNGIGKDVFWKAISSGKSGIREISKFDTANHSCKIAGEVLPEWYEKMLKELPEWLPDSKACKFSVLAAKLALEDAGLTPEEVGERNSAVYMGVSSQDMEVIQREYKNQMENGLTTPGFLASGFPHIPALIISHFLKSFENVVTISTTCTSAVNCIYYAANMINNGEVDIAIVGGVDTAITPLVMSGFCSAGLVSTKYNDTPKKASRPFDQNRDGGILSEGAGIVILEEKKYAQRRKSQIYASFAGGGLSTAMSPSWMKSSMQDAMSKALNSACLKTNQIDYISASAPGDVMIDQVETEAIKGLFGTNAYNIPISSIKSMIGNPGAAAGLFQVITTALSIKYKYIPPTVNLEQAGDKCDLDFVPIKGRVARVNRVMVNMRGFGGGFTSLVFNSSD